MKKSTGNFLKKLFSFSPVLLTRSVLCKPCTSESPEGLGKMQTLIFWVSVLISVRNEEAGLTKFSKALLEM